MIMRKPPSEHDEWLEENKEPEKKPMPVKKSAQRPSLNNPSSSERRFKALNDDIQEFG
jgi:hypothetical protein